MDSDEKLTTVLPTWTFPLTVYLSDESSTASCRLEPLNPRAGVLPGRGFHFSAQFQNFLLLLDHVHDKRSRCVVSHHQSQVWRVSAKSQAVIDPASRRHIQTRTDTCLSLSSPNNGISFNDLSQSLRSIHSDHTKCLSGRV